MRSQRGSVTLLGVLLALSILLAMLLVAVPTAVKFKQVGNENAAATQLEQLSAAESAAFQLYGAYVAPSALEGNLNSQQSCTNMFLASGAQVQNPAGYILTFNSGSPAAIPNCSVQAYASYSLNADPQNLLYAHRHFYVGTDQVLHCNQLQKASAADPACYFIQSSQTTTSTAPPPQTPPVLYSGSVTAVFPGGANGNFFGSLNGSNSSFSTGFVNVQASIGSGGLAQVSTLAVTLSSPANTTLGFQIVYEIQQQNLSYLPNECVIAVGETSCSVSLTALPAVSGTLNAAMSFFNNSSNTLNATATWSIYGEQ